MWTLSETPRQVHESALNLWPGQASGLNHAGGDDVGALLRLHQQSTELLETPAAAENSAAEMTRVVRKT